MSLSARNIRPSLTVRHNRRVLIVTDDVTRSVALIDHLRELSLDVVICVYDGEIIQDFPNQAPAAVLCVLSDYIEHAAAIISDLRARYQPSEFPVLGRLTRDMTGDHPFDSVLFAPVHPVQVARRMASLIRLGQMEREIVRRIDTARQSFGLAHSLNDQGLRRPFRILFIGRADPAYMAVTHALKGQNAEIVAAFTSFSAFDYLHEGSFDGVVMNALEGTEPALTISDTIRRNPKLFHVPTLLLVDETTFRDTALALRQGIKDIIDVNASSAELSGRILELANEHRLHDWLKREFRNFGGEACSDPATGVFNADFLSPHLRRVSRDCRARNVPLTILAVKLIPSSVSAIAPGSLAAALDQSIRLIAGVVRMQDVVARIDDDTLVIAFPEERREEVGLISQRIEALIETAAFDLPYNRTDAALSLSVKCEIVSHTDLDHATGQADAPAMQLVV